MGRRIRRGKVKLTGSRRGVRGKKGEGGCQRSCSARAKGSHECAPAPSPPPSSLPVPSPRPRPDPRHPRPHCPRSASLHPHRILTAQRCSLVTPCDVHLLSEAQVAVQRGAAFAGRGCDLQSHVLWSLPLSFFVEEAVYE